ncbi:Exodeoxyribonuclease VII small subunit [Raineyella antarctica]|uniref:Exodeoxyribonuclease 7 small subunit n=1 Tax=Raineyella antarctica TaxID=1577474 RepID=A0A1G6GDC5_9ACTN|nr:exodeoxyribonuclease VII small subunit [Raineyella antarctica]SDB79970.1 Exodeoxyribonuclease VII small subunit [Raineyella antarctica]
MSEQQPTGELSYEQAREQLVQVVQQLESGGATLSESLALWERGEKLADTCQRWLDGARSRIEAARAQRPATPGGTE